MVDFHQFQSLSKYERRVDLKKLKFIYDAVAHYVHESSTELAKLKILEVGCGDGSITLPLSAVGGSITAFDLDDTRLSILKKDIEERDVGNISVSKDDAYTFNRNEKFDIIVVSEVLEHLDRPDEVVINLKKHLAERGYCIVTVPNGFGPWELSNKIKKIFSPNSVRDSECGHKHVQFFSLNRFLHLFSNNKLKMIRFGKSDAFTGISYCIAKNRIIANADICLADLLPSWLASGWYFVFKNDEERDGR